MLLFFHKLYNHLPVDATALNTTLSAIENSLDMINTSVEAVNELQTTISSLCSMIMNCNASALGDAVDNLTMVKLGTLNALSPELCITVSVHLVQQSIVIVCVVIKLSTPHGSSVCT